MDRWVFLEGKIDLWFRSISVHIARFPSNPYLGSIFAATEEYLLGRYRHH